MILRMDKGQGVLHRLVSVVAFKYSHFIENVWDGTWDQEENL